MLTTLTTLTTIAALATALSPPLRPANPPLPTLPAELVVEVEQAKPLKLVKLVYDAEHSELALEGALEATITNGSKSTLRIERLEVHGFVFEDVDSGALHVLVHPCQCVRDASADAPPPITLKAGATETVEVQEWGCSGMWDPPPPGTYRVTYRVRAAAAPVKPPEERPDIREAIKNCRERFTSEAFWSEPRARASKPIEVTLKKARNKRVR